MSTPPSKRGGRRPGAGRPSGLLGKAQVRSITLPATLWAILDQQRGTLTASQWIAADPRLK